MSEGKADFAGIVAKAEAGDDEAQYYLGQMYEDGNGYCLCDQNVEGDCDVVVLVYNICEDTDYNGVDSFTFTVSDSDLKLAVSLMNEHKNEIGFQRIITNDKLSKISIIGLGMRTHSGVAKKMFTTLASKNINIHVISTSEIKISVLVNEEFTELAVKALHSVFELD